MHCIRPRGFLCCIFFAVFSAASLAQTSKISFAAGTPEDLALNAITNEPDTQKKIAMYDDFLQKFSTNPDAVAYGDWQLAQTYQATGDLAKALEFGDKAVAAAPRNLDILVTEASIAQQAKNSDKVMDGAVAGGNLYHSIDKQAKPEGVNDADFASRVEQEKSAAQSSYEFLEGTAFNTISGEDSAQKRMGYIERFTPAFPNSRFAGPISSYAMMSLSELKDMSLGDLLEGIVLHAFEGKAAFSPSTLREIEQFISRVQVLDFGASAAIAYGRLRAQLRKAGTPIGPLDTLIAGHALAEGAVLVTNNEREFTRVPGLVVENWLA